MKLLTHCGKQYHRNNMNVVCRIKRVHAQIHTSLWNYNEMDQGVDGDDEDRCRGVKIQAAVVMDALLQVPPPDPHRDDISQFSGFFVCPFHDSFAQCEST
jgi:hypothetical protein